MILLPLVDSLLWGPDDAVSKLLIYALKQKLPFHWKDLLPNHFFCLELSKKHVPAELWFSLLQKAHAKTPSATGKNRVTVTFNSHW